jgi:hypothetical protein
MIAVATLEEAVGIVTHRAFSSMTATFVTERPSIAGSATLASHRSAPRSDRRMITLDEIRTPWSGPLRPPQINVIMPSAIIIL